jgi:UDP-glucuronate 4-epimerase
MKILVTGSAGFIGAAVTKRLLQRGDVVIGLDNHNNYYDPDLKEGRVAQFIDHPQYKHLRLDIADRERVKQAFAVHQPNRVIHLAAQAGVRYSLDNPLAYIDSNLVGFANILESCRGHSVEHLVYASTSSVYGANEQLPFSVKQNVDHPLSLYAATKKANELMAHSYSHLYNIPTTGLRFFTVYGPWGRPDMALFKFTKSILAGEAITLFNNGEHRRDFTYIDDIVEGILRVIDRPATSNVNWDGLKPDPSSSSAPYKIYNIGNGTPIKLMDYVTALENALGKMVKKEFLPLQAGDIIDTHADMAEFIDTFQPVSKTSVQAGINHFAAWYLEYYES